MDRPDVSEIVAVSTRLRLRAGAEIAAWQAQFTRALAAADGFVSVEIAAAGPSAWQIIQHFRSAELLTQWQNSKLRTSQFAALSPMLAGEISDEAAPDFHSLASVTEVITTSVERGREQAFQNWSEQMQAAQGRFPGYLGTLVQAPMSAAAPNWTTLVRFATPADLEAWLNSPERKALLQASDPSVSQWKSHRLDNPFGGWFESKPDQPAPPAWKQTALVLLVLFPVVMLEIKFLSPLLAGWHVALATFIGNAISVSLVSWPLMGVAIHFLGWWLNPAPAARMQTEMRGAATVLALYAIELAIFVVF